MSILVTGGTGGTSRALVPLLQRASIPFILTSRRGAAAGLPSDIRVCKFDWLDESTFEVPFAELKDIRAIYLIAPAGAPDPDTPMIRFVDLAHQKYGVNRFVLCGGGSIQPGGPFLGKILKHLMEGPWEFALLRPTWFNENFIEESWGFKQTIKNEGKIYTATAPGKAPFVATQDIARVAFQALMMKEKPKLDYHCLGPEMLTYDDLAEKFSKALGRKIEHVKLSPEERQQQQVKAGSPQEWAGFIVFLETYMKDGNEERPGKPKDDVETLTGSPGIKFDDWLRQNISVWQ